MFTHDPIALQVQDLTNLLYDLNPVTANALCYLHRDTYQQMANKVRLGLPLKLTCECHELIDDLILSIDAHGGPHRRSQRTLA